VIANNSLAHDEETTLAKKHGRDNSPGQLGVKVSRFFAATTPSPN
jgi:hypothetical protein